MWICTRRESVRESQGIANARLGLSFSQTMSDSYVCRDFLHFWGCFTDIGTLPNGFANIEFSVMAQSL